MEYHMKRTRLLAAIISEHCVAASIQLGQDFAQRSPHLCFMLHRIALETVSLANCIIFYV